MTESVDIHRFSSWVFTVAMIWSRTSSASISASSRAAPRFVQPRHLHAGPELETVG